MSGARAAGGRAAAPRFGVLTVTAAQRRRRRNSFAVSVAAQAGLWLALAWCFSGARPAQSAARTAEFTVTWLAAPEMGVAPAPAAATRLAMPRRRQPPRRAAIAPPVRAPMVPALRAPRERRLVAAPDRETMAGVVLGRLPRRPVPRPPQPARLAAVRLGAFAAPMRGPADPAPASRPMLGAFGGEGDSAAGRAAGRAAERAAEREGNRAEDRPAAAQPEPRTTAVRLGAFSGPHAPAVAATAAVTTPAVREGVFQRVAPARLKRAAKLAARRGRYHPPVILSKPQPVYPPAARAAGAAGTVILRVLLTAAGRVRVLAVLHGLGPLLNRAAKTAAEGIRFRPARRGAQALDVVVEVRVQFRLAE